jgi:23S rRNA (uracil1939-C5)-methyltransferase
MDIKERWVRENLSRIGHVHPEFDPAIPSPREGRYRNKAQYPIRRVNSRITTGFFAPRSHELVPMFDCPLQPEAFADIAKAFCGFIEERGLEPYDEADGSGLIRGLYLRLGEATGQVMVCPIVNGGGIPGEAELVERLLAACPQIETVVININRGRGNAVLGDGERVIHGGGKIEDVLAGARVALSPRSFYQVNRSCAELLYAKALEYAAPAPGDTVLDMYCGAGTIGLSMAGKAGRIIGVEVVGSAVADARENAVRNNIANAEFILADAVEAAAELEARGVRPDIVLLDPPRKGAAPETLAAIARRAPRRIVYVSCDSATLARDCARLAELGYNAARADAVDMFPRTAHVESVVLLER